MPKISPVTPSYGNAQAVNRCKLGSVTYRGAPFRAWQLTITRNVVIDDAKSARWRIAVPLPEHFDGPANVTDPETAATNRELADKVRSLLPDLSPD